MTTSILNSSSKYINNYNFKTVDKISEFEEEIILEKLNKYTTYSIIVQAFNSKGSGPASEPILIRTKEDGNYINNNKPENWRKIVISDILRKCLTLKQLTCLLIYLKDVAKFNYIYIRNELFRIFCD